MKGPSIERVSCNHCADDSAEVGDCNHCMSRIFTEYFYRHVPFHDFQRYGHHGREDGGICEDSAKPIRIVKQPCFF